MIGKLLSVIVAILLFPATWSMAVGAPDYLPDGAHPRIFLNTEELSRLNAKQSASDQDVMDLISWCDAHIGDVGYDSGDVRWDGDGSFSGYRMTGFHKYLMNYSLAYQILKDDDPTKAASYASYVRDILFGILEGLKSGEENNGLKALRCSEINDITINAAEAAALGITAGSYKLGYAARMVSAVAIAYDWVFETLSTGDRALIEGMLYRWFDWMIGERSSYNNGVLVSGTRYHEDTAGDCTGINNCTSWTGAAQKLYSFGNMGHNFMAGATYLMALVPVATYGENADAASYLEKFKSILSTYIVPQLSDPLRVSGGDSVEGWNYASSYSRVVTGLYGYWLATGDPSAEFGLSGDLVSAMVHRVAQDRSSVPIYGQWTGTPFGINRKEFAIPFIGVEQKINPLSTESGVGQYILQNYTFLDDVDYWQKILWTSGDISTINVAVLPLSNNTSGAALWTTRSSWTDADGVFAAARLEGKNQVGDHEGYDEGNIEILRGGDRLISPSNVVSGVPNAWGYSTVVFNNANHHAHPLQTLSSPAINRIKEGVTYSYVSADITPAWKRDMQTSRAELFRRSILHIRPGVFVIHDITRSSSVGNLKEWYTQYTANPSQTTDTITVSTGNSKAFVKSLYPVGGSFTETNPATGYYSVKYVSETANEYEQFLHVVEVGSSSSSQTATSLVSGVGWRGAKVGTTISIFTASQTGEDITGIDYTTDATMHIISDLPQNSNVSISRNGSAVDGSPFSTGEAGIISFSTPSGSANYQLGGGGPPPTWTSASLNGNGNAEMNGAGSLTIQ